ncbi:histone-lysine N-methyltransferase SETMAR-like [Ptiloglossa arizonensis]|uniref:histone-lysine N-methyltransferase SETMAR-like n=1 Tax=Ptiloglossa arizonensis TaxID=3350558 RepID=UPI003FA1369E
MKHVKIEINEVKARYVDPFFKCTVTVQCQTCDSKYFAYIFNRSFLQNAQSIQSLTCSIPNYFCTNTVSVPLLNMSHLVNFDIKNAPRSRRLIKVDGDKIQALMDLNRRLTTREIVKRLDISKIECWESFETTWIHHAESIMNLLKAHQKNIMFYYICQKKIMLSIWWDFRGIVYFELLSRNQNINSNVYRRQLDKLNDVIKEKRLELVNRKDVMFHQDNARPHRSLVTCEKLHFLILSTSLDPILVITTTVPTVKAPIVAVSAAQSAMEIDGPGTPGGGGAAINK